MKHQANISIREIKENKEDYLNLLLIADPSVDMIQHYLGRGHLYIMQLEEIPVCVTVVVSDKETGRNKKPGNPSRLSTPGICQSNDEFYCRAL